MRQWITASEATKLLGISRATLYAYVSRGFVRSEPVAGRPRERRYAREDVERLRSRAEERRNPAKAAEHALRWGVPVLESAIALIDGDRLYYRGHDVAELVRTRSLEEVAALLWTGSFETDLLDTPLHVIAGTPATHDLAFVTRAQSVLPIVAARDPLAFDLRPRAVAQSGWRIVNLLTSVAAESQTLEDTVETTLARSWAPNDPRAAEIIRATLIVAADHELNVSAFTGRCVASAGSNPYAVVAAGLAALEGTKHGGTTVRVEVMLSDLRRSRDLRRTLGERLKRGEGVDGFGHRLYPKADPRAALLLELLRERYPKSKELAFVTAFADAVEGILDERPNLDFGLAAVGRVLGLPPGAPLTLFAIGRTHGWIAHAIEQYETNAIIRPRARYVGRAPGARR